MRKPARRALAWAIPWGLMAAPVGAQTFFGPSVPFGGCPFGLGPETTLAALVHSGCVNAPPDAAWPAFQAAPGSSPWLGVAIGGVIGSAATYLVLNSGGSTAPCDESANQDAIGTRYCVGLYVLGGLAGAGIGWLVSRWISGSPGPDPPGP